MHPAKSVIFFTTASGAGYGLLALFALMDLMGYVPREQTITVLTFGLAFLLITVGLLSSTFHLGHPERAWRALSQWRSSWLSREGVMAIVTYGPTGLYALVRFLNPEAALPVEPLLAVASIVTCVVTVYCTAMIYASLKTIAAWSNEWTPICYLAIAGSSGAVFLSALAYANGFFGMEIKGATVTLIIVAWLAKSTYYKKVLPRSSKSTVGTATGLGRDGETVRLLEGPHTEENYLMSEMGFRIARKHADRLRSRAQLSGFVFPGAGILMLGPEFDLPNFILIVISVMTTIIGVLAERLLFFAEAKHTVTLYYGARTA